MGKGNILVLGGFLVVLILGVIALWKFQVVNITGPGGIKIEAKNKPKEGSKIPQEVVEEGAEKIPSTIPTIPKKEAEKESKKEEISLTGCITSPSSSSQVARWFQVEGTIHGQHRHLWIVERIGQLYWPKKPKLKPQNGRWAGEVNEGGWPPGGRLEILLVDVSNKVDRKFCEWLRNGHQTGHYPGLHSEEIKDANILDFKEYQLITE